jgi:arabinose-5-phosphate isomerase
MDYLALAREVFTNEIEGLRAVADQLGEGFVQLVERSRATFAHHGKLVLTGVGKSGHIGHKIAATLASTGSPAVFMHPVEAMHGDLGVLTPHRDLLLCLSYSGETEELLTVLPAAKRFHVPIVAITGAPESRLAKWSDLVVAMPVPGEACPFNLAPTTSTTALLALGDALAIVLMRANDFSKADYGLRHPGGAIGRSVTLRIADLMRPPERTPIVPPETLVGDALYRMTTCRSGSVIVAAADRTLLGIFTDGDFRRRAQHDLAILQQPIHKVMTANPIRLRIDQMAIEVLNLLEQREIDDIPVVDAANRVVGLVDIQDLPKFKLM